ncbi:MAG: hypothetical protein FIB08_17745 [Candidatus Methanoperedens sp.]|nr:hypothetical protein [Candidatus Methanoperedens sp.]
MDKGSKQKMEINAIATDSLSWRHLVLPIRVGIEPMERLLVTSFKNDPEFEGLEPQVFDDPINGKGMRVLRYRKDGMVDVYLQVEGNRRTRREAAISGEWKRKGK